MRFVTQISLISPQACARVLVVGFWPQSSQGRNRRREIPMRSAWVTVVSLTALCLMFCGEAVAQQCAVAYPQTIECYGQGGCHGYVTTYFCSGFGESYTCGAPCTGSISCCGSVYGYNPYLCHSFCTGCKLEDARTATLRQPSGKNKKTSVFANVVECSKADGIASALDLSNPEEKSGQRSNDPTLRDAETTAGKAGAPHGSPQSDAGRSGARR
jgi:hypothetical protein